MVKINLSLDSKAEYDLMMSALESQRAFANTHANNTEHSVRDRGEYRKTADALAGLIKTLSGSKTR